MYLHTCPLACALSPSVSLSVSLWSPAALLSSPGFVHRGHFRVQATATYYCGFVFKVSHPLLLVLVSPFLSRAFCCEVLVYSLFFPVKRAFSSRGNRNQIRELLFLIFRIIPLTSFPFSLWSRNNLDCLQPLSVLSCCLVFWFWGLGSLETEAFPTLSSAAHLTVQPVTGADPKFCAHAFDP